MEITVAGVPYVLRFDDLNHKVETELYKASGLTVPEILVAGQRGATAPFMIAALVFVARRLAGDNVTYDEVADAISYDTLSSDFAVREVTVETDSAPEALAAD